MEPVSSQPALARRLGTADAVLIGMGSMMGAGMFAVWAPAARAAGAGLLIGLVIAAAVAYANATSSAQLAAVYPTSGGTYAYGRERLGPWWGFAAGWSFVIGKTASCAAMALTVAAYAVGGPLWRQRLVAVAVVLALAALNYRGITRTALLTRVLVTGTAIVLAVVVVASLTAPDVVHAMPNPWAPNSTGTSVTGVLQSGGLLFFAFAGYARIATMGEEVREPRRTIPRAITLALAATVVVYAVIAVTALMVAGAPALAASSSPLTTVLEAAGRPALTPLVRLGAALAASGALLALIAGIGRTSLAMAREGDLPAWCAAVHPRFRVPHHAEIVLAVVVCALVLTVDLRGAIGFSSFGVLLYYAIANASAFTQPDADRRWPRALQLAGLAGCLVLAFSLPIGSVLAGIAVVGVGLVGRLVALVRRRR